MGWRAEVADKWVVLDYLQSTMLTVKHTRTPGLCEDSCKSDAPRCVSPFAAGL